MALRALSFWPPVYALRPRRRFGGMRVLREQLIEVQLHGIEWIDVGRPGANTGACIDRHVLQQQAVGGRIL